MTNVELKPCPFCKQAVDWTTNFYIRPNQIWTGKSYQVNHYELAHFCHGSSGFPSTRITMNAKTQEELFIMWNNATP